MAGNKAPRKKRSSVVVSKHEQRFSKQKEDAYLDLNKMSKTVDEVAVELRKLPVNEALLATLDEEKAKTVKDNYSSLTKLLSDFDQIRSELTTKLSALSLPKKRDVGQEFNFHTDMNFINQKLVAMMPELVAPIAALSEELSTILLEAQVKMESA